MSEQRSRRSFLAAGSLLGGSFVLGSGAGWVAGGESTVVDVLSAGSLVVALDERMGPAFGRTSEYGYRGEFHGSNAVMELVSGRQKRPDVVVSADVGLLRDRLYPDHASWDVVFATNEVGITYNPETRIGQRLDAGEPWYEVLADGGADAGRTDPNVDPLGYRTIQLFDLAERHYDRTGLARNLRTNSSAVAQESHLLAGVETGDRPAAYCYRNMAADHGLPFVELPGPLNFGDPAYADHYASATYTTDRGRTIEGSPVAYAATVPGNAARPEAGQAFLRFLLTESDLLRESGLVVPESLPETHGAVPTTVRASTER